ncbi:hypothetical protein IGI04_014272, partial [Brassica rapa subsp. trilocularis]
SHLNVFEFAGFSDLRQILKDFSEDFRTTSQNTLGKCSNAFYARRLPTKSSGSLPTSYAESDLSQTLEKFSEDSWKTLGRLSEDFLGSFLMYFMLDDFP